MTISTDEYHAAAARTMSEAFSAYECGFWYNQGNEIENSGGVGAPRSMTRLELATVPHKDPIAYKEYQRRYRRSHREKRASERPDYDRSRHANQRAARYGVSGRITVHDVRRVMASGKCHYCGSTERLGIDHVVPLHRDGANHLKNLVCCCHSCNASKYRGDRPRRWARDHDTCVMCGSNERKHVCHGLCSRCYSRKHSRERRARENRIGDDRGRAA